jgi:hypothetical protein
MEKQLAQINEYCAAHMIVAINAEAIDSNGPHCDWSYFLKPGTRAIVPLVGQSPTIWPFLKKCLGAYCNDMQHNRCVVATFQRVNIGSELPFPTIYKAAGQLGVVNIKAPAYTLVPVFRTWGQWLSSAEGLAYEKAASAYLNVDGILYLLD